MFQIPDETTQILKIQIDGIVRHLKSDYEVWKSCHMNGWPLVVNISQIYGKCLTRLKNLEKFRTTQSLKRERSKLKLCRRFLKEPCERITWLVDRLLDATEHTRESLKILRGLCTDSKISEKILYRNWQLRDFLDFTETVMRLYDAEYEIKEMVMEELSNCKNREDLAFMRQAWRVPNHALTQEFINMFQEFDYETNEIRHM